MWLLWWIPALLGLLFQQGRQTTLWNRAGRRQGQNAFGLRREDDRQFQGEKDKQITLEVISQTLNITLVNDIKTLHASLKFKFKFACITDVIKLTDTFMFLGALSSIFSGVFSRYFHFLPPKFSFNLLPSFLVRFGGAIVNFPYNPKPCIYLLTYWHVSALRGNREKEWWGGAPLLPFHSSLGEWESCSFD